MNTILNSLKLKENNYYIQKKHVKRIVIIMLWSIQCKYEALPFELYLKCVLSIIISAIADVLKKPLFGKLCEFLLMMWLLSEFILTEKYNQAWFIYPAAVLAGPLYVLQESEKITYSVLTYIILTTLNLSVARPNLLAMLNNFDSNFNEKAIQTYTIYTSTASIYYLFSGIVLKISRDEMIHKLNIQNIRLDALNQSLEEKNKQLEDAIKKKERFLLSVSHECRNPLNVITGYVDLALLSNTIDTNIKSYLEDIKTRAQLLAIIISNLIDGARAIDNKMEANLQPIKLKDLLTQKLQIYKALMNDKGLCGQFLIRKNLPDTIMIDQGKVLQIFYNILSNAVKYTQNGYVSVVINWVNGNIADQDMVRPKEEDIFRTLFERKCNFNDNDIINPNQISTKVKSVYSLKHGYIKSFMSVDIFENYHHCNLNSDISFKNDIFKCCMNKSHKILENSEKKGYLKLEIYDNGCGITQDQIHKALQNPHEMYDAINQARLGVGLGLWVSKKLCQICDGYLKIYSDVGKGTLCVINIKCGIAQLEKNKILQNQNL